MEEQARAVADFFERTPEGSAVSGTASFEPEAEGCHFRYSLESLRGRPPNHEQEVAQAFASWIRSRRMR